MTRPSVYEAAGGAEAFLALATAHHERCLQDPILEHPFSHGGHPDHVARLGRYWAEVFGGPPEYSTTCGGQPSMLRVHAGSEPEESMGSRFVECFVAAADDARLPADPELRQVLRSYMEWAVSDVLEYAPRGSRVPGTLPVPCWSWEGLVR
ncbi:MAG: group II truncated hemoglobin [Pseudonocardia sp.]|nr:group II truncated hemoglobin [Pseudonocardia sp.]